MLDLKVTYFEKVIANTYRLNANDVKHSTFSFIAGQYINLFFTINNRIIKRSYSIISSPNDLPQIDLLIKLNNESELESYFEEKLKIGARIRASMPTGNLTYSTSQKEITDIVLIATGSGITPLFSIAKEFLASPNSKSAILFFGNRNENRILLYEEILKLINNHKEKLKVIHSLSAPGKNWKGSVGRLTPEFVLKSLPTDGIKKYHYYLCGQKEMISEMNSFFRKSGISKNHIHFEDHVSDFIEAGT